MALIQQRRLGLLDLMVLIAAMALGLAAVPFVLREITTPLRIGWRYRIDLFRSCVAPSLAALTLASLGLALIPPRPRLRRLVRTPGFVTCATAAVGLVVVCPINFTAYLYMWYDMISRSGRTVPSAWWADQLAILIGQQSYPVGLMVAGAWIALLLGGRLRAGDQRDRMGLAIGACWIALFVSGWMWYL